MLGENGGLYEPRGALGEKETLKCARGLIIEGA